jgi:hypothetical protein
MEPGHNSRLGVGSRVTQTFGLPGVTSDAQLKRTSNKVGSVSITPNF